ncbi:amidohydrolase family protein [Bacillus sp. ISL-77]|uniref:amidohydrolase family protein n=1 Tax=Bacillus sp. ISL-77 TaxID=2819138 RepID=UPI001BEBCC14|nr:amidohydrolase family protein [Bacillus sp. ISL-77]MBT2739941.1 amidohydrolase [Bacillus sp. ISL-77]
MSKGENFRVDFHTHIIPENFPDFAEKYADDRFPILKHTCSCGAEIYKDGKSFRKVDENAWNPEKRIAEMDAEGVDVQVLSPIPVTFIYWADAEKCLELSKAQNDFIASVVAEYPDRFVGLGTVPLQDADLAIAEMERVINELGLVGIEIGSNANGKTLDDPEIQRFLEAAAKMDVPILVHPWMTVGEERMPKHNFMYSIGMPSETALAAGSLIFSGIFDKYPDLKICFAHGGGTLPYLLPRIDQAWEVWPHIRTTEQPPSYYAKKIYYDTLVYDPRNLQFMLEKFEADHIIMGTDYPFLLREAPPGNVVEMLENVLDEEKIKMLGENAIEFLGLNKASFIKETV